MLSAILLRKAGHNLKSVKWQELFKPTEDSLTSSVFGLLKLLPNELFWRIVNESIYHHNPFNGAYMINEYSFWPRWKNREQETVEPDLFIRTMDFDLIIEAKRGDDDQQREEQWVRELSAYFDEIEAQIQPQTRTVHLLAVGGIKRERPQPIIIGNYKVHIYTMRWTILLNTILRIRKKLNSNKGLLSSIDSCILILNDIVDYFSIHGFNAGCSLEDQDFESYKLGNFELTIEVLKLNKDEEQK
jgi:hypothetical protein